MKRTIRPWIQFPRPQKFRRFTTGRRFFGPARPWRRRVFRRGRIAHNGKGTELKFKDTVFDDAVVAAGGAVSTSLVLIGQGTGESERVGRKITIRQIGFRFEMQLGAQTAASATNDVCRVMMFLDKQANRANTTVTGDSGILIAADYQAFNNLSNKSRYLTLMDRTYDINLDAGGGDGTTEDYGAKIVSDSFYKKVNIGIEYSAGGTGAITEITSNNLAILVISKSGLVTFNSTTRLRYSDI